MTTAQRGFAHLYILIAVLVVVLVGGIGITIAHHNTGSTGQSATLPSPTPKQAQESPTATITPSQTPSPTPTSTTKVVRTTATTPTPVAHPTDQDIAGARVDAYSIQTMLEAYFSNYNTYTWSLDAQDQQLLESQPGYSSSGGSPFNTPPGTSLSYVCQKGVGYNCTAYQLQALEANGTVIVTLTNLN
jgi:hypothetical protein